MSSFTVILAGTELDFYSRKSFQHFGILGLVFIWQAVSITGQQLEGATTCDENYYDNGRFCAWFTFMCEDNNAATALIPTCFNGFKQSPIDLSMSSVEAATDPGGIVFRGYDLELGPSAVLRIQNFALQLDL